MRDRLRGKRAWIALLIAAAAVLPAVLAAGAPGHWSSRVVDQLRGRGVLVSTAAPDSAIQRTDVARLLVGALGLTQDAEDLRAQPSRFYDVPIGEKAAYIEIAAEAGVMRGYGGGLFGPDDPLTRAQLVTVLARAMGWEDRARKDAGQPLPFPDAATVPAWARGYVAVASEEKLVAGFDDGTFRPNANVTQAEAATLVGRFMAGRGSLFQREGALEQSPDAQGRLVLAGEPLTLASGAVVYRSGQPAAPSALQPGEQARAILNESGRVTYIESWPVAFSGLLQGVSAETGEVTVMAADQRTVQYAVTGGVRVFRNGQPAALPDLQAGDRVYGFLDSARRITALDATRIDLTGQLIGVTAGEPLRILVTSPAGQLGAPLSPGAAIFINGQRAQAADLRPADEVGLSRDQSGAVVYLEVHR